MRRRQIIEGENPQKTANRFINNTFQGTGVIISLKCHVTPLLKNLQWLSLVYIA